MKIDESIRKIFEVYFQRSFAPEIHENCIGCKRELSLEEMEKDLKYQEKLTEIFSSKIKREFSAEEIFHLADLISDPVTARFMQEAFVFCNEDACTLRQSIFGDDDGEYDERRII